MTSRFTTEPTSYDTSTSPPPNPNRRMSAHAQADAARAMQHTNSWTPAFGRRPSFNKEDQKHALHMTSIDEVKTGPGFSERKTS